MNGWRALARALGDGNLCYGNNSFSPMDCNLFSNLWLLELVAQSSERTTALGNQPQPTLPAPQPTPHDAMAFCKVKSQPPAV